MLLILHSLFGAVFLRATELLDTSKFTIYQTQDGLRKLLKINSKSEEYSIFCDVNYCRCQAFKYQVLRSKSAFTCKHYIASKLVEVTGKYKNEILSDSQFIELLECLHEFWQLFVVLFLKSFVSSLLFSDSLVLILYL